MVAGQQGQHRLVEQQDREEDQDACGRVQTKWDYRLVAFIPCLAVNGDVKGVSAPDRMKQKEAGLRKNGSPLLRDMAIQMEPIAIMVRLRRARMAAARFRSMRGEDGKKQCRRKCENL